MVFQIEYISFYNRFQLLKIIKNNNKNKYFEKNYLDKLICENKKDLI